MKSKKRVVRVMARNNNIDPDRLLLEMWYHREVFHYIKSVNDVVKNKDISAARYLVSVIRRPDSPEVSKKPIKEAPLDYKDFEYESVGHLVHSMRHVSRDELIQIHTELSSDLEVHEDPIVPSGIKDEHLLNSALTHPHTAWGGVMKYPTLESAGAALVYALTHNHPFHNGNKRTALVALLVFLDRHNIQLTCSEDELFKFALDVADHVLVNAEYRYADAEVFAIAKWIQDNSRSVSKGERVVTLRKLRQILTGFECEILENGKVSRQINRPNFWNRGKTITLLSKRAIPTLADGVEVNRTLIKSLREDLELDAQHGIDSEAFYANSEYTSSEFIVIYAKLLRRLSKF